MSVACSPKEAGGEEARGEEGEKGQGKREGAGGEEGAGREDCFGIEYPPGEVHEVDDFEEANGFVVIVSCVLSTFSL